MKAIPATFVCLLVLALCGCATPRARPLTMTSLDVNRNGRVEESELWEGLKKQSFEQADADADQQLTRKEWDAAHTGEEARGQFDAADTDKNGSISYAEYSAFSDQNKPDMNRLFRDMDTNKDGNLSPDELNARPVGTLFKWSF